MIFWESYNVCCLQRDLSASFADDGLLEVVGFRDAWHGLDLLALHGHGTRLAQVKTLERYTNNITDSSYVPFSLLYRHTEFDLGFTREQQITHTCELMENRGNNLFL